MFKTVVIVGFGNIGFRHFQGLIKDCRNLKIHIVDRDPKAICRISKDMFEEIESRNIGITFASDYKDLESSFDYAIVATQSNVRFDVLQELLRKTTPNSILLEKVLFDRREQYDASIELVDSMKIDTRVNCWRRIFPSYIRAKEFFDITESRVCSIKISGGDIGLGCNGVHFFDLIAFFSGETVFITKTSLDPGVVASKRSGFMEFSGQLEGVSGTLEFVINSKRDNDQQVIVELVSQDKKVTVKEASNEIVLQNILTSDEVIEKLRTPFLSDVSGKIANALLCGESAGLPSLREASATHKLLLDVLSKHAAKTVDIADGVYPVT